MDNGSYPVGSIDIWYNYVVQKSVRFLSLSETSVSDYVQKMKLCDICEIGKYANDKLIINAYDRLELDICASCEKEIRKYIKRMKRDFRR